MIDLYFWPTPNGLKLKIFLEEAELAYRVVPVDITRGEQFEPGFLAISPNNKIPALVDHAPRDGGEPLALFESGAMLLYLAEKISRFIPADARGRAGVLKWLFWQVGGLGPMAGQNAHFRSVPTEAYAIERFNKETGRLYGVLDRWLANHEYLAQEYSIADMAVYPWIVRHAAHGQNLADYPWLARWYASVQRRPAVARAYDRDAARAANG